MDAVESLRLFFNEFNDKSVTADGMDVETLPKYIQIMVRSILLTLEHVPDY